jgi:hypothetical protein
MSRSTVQRATAIPSDHLLPDLVGAVDLQVDLPDAFDVWNQDIIAPGAGAAQGRIAQMRCMTPVA